MRGRLRLLFKGYQTGYEDGKTVKIEYRWADGQYDRLPSMAADLVRDQVAVIAALGTPAVRVAKAATATIPIAFATIADPVQMGFVTSLNRPGGNLTGVTLLAVEVGPKLLEILRGVVPSATIIALLVNPTNPNSEMQSKNTQEAAHKLGLELHVLNASVENDFDSAFTKLRELKASALIIAQDVYFNAESARLAALTGRHAIPAIYPLPEFAVAGGLFSYGASRSDAWRQAGVYVGRILKGEKPAELPVVHANGATASRAVLAYLVAAIDRLSNPASCAEVVEEANRDLFELMHEHEESLGMGTTLVGAVLTANQLVTFNVGDSRCYLFSAGQLVQLSDDDVPEGETDRFGPRRSHVLTQALGGSSFPLTIEPHVTVDAPLAPGEILLLCSDGLSDMVANQVIRDIISRAKAPLQAARGLAGKAFSAGAKDNLSVIVARRTGASPEPAA